MKIYFVRHAESEGNANKYYQTPDTKLTAYGKNQAELLAKGMKDVEVDYIYSSTHLRAKETAKPISEVMGKKVILKEDFQEIKNPSEIFENSHNSKKAKEIFKRIENNYHKGDWRYSNEESFSDAKKRASSVLKFLTDEHKKDDRIMVVSHSSFTKLVVFLLLFEEKLTPDLFWNIRFHLWFANASVSIVEQLPRIGKTSWHLTSWNDTSYRETKN